MTIGSFLSLPCGALEGFTFSRLAILGCAILTPQGFVPIFHLLHLEHITFASSFLFVVLPGILISTNLPHLKHLYFMIIPFPH